MEVTDHQAEIQTLNVCDPISNFEYFSTWILIGGQWVIDVCLNFKQFASPKANCYLHGRSLLLHSSGFLPARLSDSSLEDFFQDLFGALNFKGVWPPQSLKVNWSNLIGSRWAFLFQSENFFSEDIRHNLIDSLIDNLIVTVY